MGGIDIDSVAIARARLAGDAPLFNWEVAE